MEEAVIKKKWKEQDPKGYEALCQEKPAPPLLQKTSLADIEEWAKPLFSQKSLIIYGLEGGLTYQALLSWLEKDRSHQAIFLEESLANISCFLSSKEASSFFSNPQVKLLWVPSEEEQQPLLQTLLTFRQYRPVAFTSSPSMASSPDRYLVLRATWNYMRQGKTWSLSELIDGGATHFSNFYRNLLWLTEAIPIVALFGAFQKVPAIIVGGGPSLKKNIDLLPSLKDKAVILSGGTAVNLLNQMQIKPHIALGCDPFPSVTERLLSNTNFEVPFAYKNRLHHNAIWTLSNPLLFIPSGPLGFTMEAFAEKKLQLAPFPFSGGGNVLNIATELAYLMGCDPIIFVGIDLAYTHDENYAYPIEKDPFTPEYVRASSKKEELLWREDIHGKPIRTLWKWIYEAFWYGHFKAEHKERVFINATEGGLGFPTIPNTSLSEIAKGFSDKSIQIDEMIEEKLTQNREKKIPFAKIVDLYDEIFEGLTGLYRTILNLESKGDKEIISLTKDPFYQYLREFFENYQEIYLELGKEKQKTDRPLPEPLTYAKHVVEYHLSQVSIAIATASNYKELLKKKDAAPNVPETRGSRTFFYDNGYMRSHLPYIENLLDGWALFFWPNGKLKRRTFFQKGKKEGTEEFFRITGELFRKATFHKNLPTGKALEWDQKGTLCRIIHYEDGRFISEKHLNRHREWVEAKKAEDFWTDLTQQSKKLADFLTTTASFFEGKSVEGLDELNQKIEALTQIGQELSERLDIEHESLSASKGAISDTQKQLNIYSLSMNELIYDIQKKLSHLKPPLEKE